MQTNVGTVFVVDDDPWLLRSMDRLLQTMGYHVETFSSAEAFLAREPAPGEACLVLDVDMPGLSGLDLQQELLERHCDIPIIFVAASADIPMTVRAMEAGAVSFLPKPFEDLELVTKIEKALALSRRDAQKNAEVMALRKRHATLTAREIEVFSEVIAGKLNKQIASDLHIVETTVKVHRGRVMRKMEANSVAELVMMAEKLGLSARPVARR